MAVGIQRRRRHAGGGVCCLLLLASLLLVGCSSDATPSGDFCSAPSLSSEPATVTPGSSVTISGTKFDDACVGSTLPGGDLPSVRLYFVQGSADVSLALLTPQSDGQLSAEVGIPDAAVPGPASVVARRADETTGNSLATVKIEIAGG